MTDAYPLLQLQEIKKKRLETAEKLLAEKKALLQKEEEKLQAATEKRNTVKSHKQEKLDQYREALDSGTTSDKIQQMRQYLKLVDEKLKIEERSVQEQTRVRNIAKTQVDLALKEVFKKQKEVEKLSQHRREWEGEAKKVSDRKQELISDEIGNVLYEKKRKGNHS